MNIQDWLAREQTYLNYLREDYIDWSAVPQQEMDSLIESASNSYTDKKLMLSWDMSPADYVKFVCDIEIDIARTGLRQYAREYAESAIQAALEEMQNESI